MENFNADPKNPDVDSFFAEEKPEYVFLPAAKVGGIKANDYWNDDEPSNLESSLEFLAM